MPQDVGEIPLKKSNDYHCRMEESMKEILENYELLFLLMGMTCVFIILKVISFCLYGKLLRESNQMGITKNKWLKSMMAKFEAYYKLRISVHNVENFVDRYLYHFRFLGLSLQSWENAGWYISVVMTGCWILSCLAGGYFEMKEKWFLTTGFVFVALLLLQAMLELIFNTRKSQKLLRVQLIDYMENTMRARLENEYFHQEEKKEYEREYFDETEDTSKEIVVAEGKSNQKELLTELMNSLLEEMELDRSIARGQSPFFRGDDSERAQLFDEILREYI